MRDSWVDLALAWLCVACVGRFEVGNLLRVEVVATSTCSWVPCSPTISIRSSILAARK